MGLERSLELRVRIRVTMLQRFKVAVMHRVGFAVTDTIRLEGWVQAEATLKITVNT